MICSGYSRNSSCAEQLDGYDEVVKSNCSCESDGYDEGSRPVARSAQRKPDWPVVERVIAAVNKRGLQFEPSMTMDGTHVAVSPKHVFVHLENERGSGASKRVFGAMAVDRVTQEREPVVHKQILDAEKFKDALAEVDMAKELQRCGVAHVIDPPLAVFKLTMAIYERDAGRSLDQCAMEELETLIPALRDAAEGLQSLHAAGYFHGDVTRGNIFVAADYSAVLGDLAATQKEGVEKFCGCRTYRPPEEFRENRKIHATRSGDIWSMGLVLHEVLSAGELPPIVHGAWMDQWKEGNKPDTIGDSDVRQGLFSKVGHSSALVDRLKRLVIRCLSSDPADRPSAGELVDELS